MLACVYQPVTSKDLCKTSIGKVNKVPVRVIKLSSFVEKPDGIGSKEVFGKKNLKSAPKDFKLRKYNFRRIKSLSSSSSESDQSDNSKSGSSSSLKEDGDLDEESWKSSSTKKVKRLVSLNKRIIEKALKGIC